MHASNRLLISRIDVVDDAIRRNTSNHPKHTLPYGAHRLGFFCGANTTQYIAALLASAGENLLKTSGPFCRSAPQGIQAYRADVRAAVFGPANTRYLFILIII